MQMKKVAVLTMLAATLGATAINPVLAQAAAQTKQVVQIEQSTYIINGSSVVIRTITDSGLTLVSVRDLAKALGASLQLSSGSITAHLNHNTVKLKGTELKTVNGISFVEPSSFTKALGGTYDSSAAIPSITTIALLTDIDHAVWINSSKLIVSKMTEIGREDYLVDAANGSNELLLASANTSDLVLSADGTKAAYSDANGAVSIIDLSTKQATVVSTDSSIKNELQWSADASALFFLQGDKSSVIAKLSLADGAVSKVLEDKVDYKANLNVSADGKLFSYNVFKQPKVTADGSKDVELDDVSIDATGTEPQVYFYNSAAADNKSIQLTTDATDKAFLQLSSDGAKAYYVSFSNDDASIGTLFSIDTASKATSAIFAEQDVYQLIQSGGKLILLTGSGAEGSRIYELDTATAEAKLVANVSDNVSELIVSSNGQIAALSDGLLAVQINGKFTTITR